MTIRSTMPGYYESRTPTRTDLTGITGPEHAKRHLDWLAASTAYRTIMRDVTTEWDGRNYVLGDSALVDNWFFDPKVSAQVDSYTVATRMLEMDGDIDVATYPYCTIRNRTGKAFGPIAITAGDEPYQVALDADDLAAAETASDLTIAQVLNTDRQEKTIVVFGARIELQEAYKVRGIRWDSRDRIKVSLTYDDPRVWTAIGANMPVYTPPSAVNDDAPGYNDVSVSAEPQDTIVIVKWTLRPLLTGQINEVALSYDGQVTWATISSSPSPTGQATVSQNGSDLVYLRARGIAQDGTPGLWSAPVGFTVPAPRLDGVYLEPGTVDARLALIEESISEANQEKSIRLSQLEDLIKALTEQVDAGYSSMFGLGAKRDQLIRRVAVERQTQDGLLSAAFNEQIDVVVGDQNALTQRTTTLESSFTTLSGSVNARFSTVETAYVAADNALSNRIDVNFASIGGLSATVTIQGAALVSLENGQVALATQVTSVEAKTDAGTGSMRWVSLAAEVGVSAPWQLQVSATGFGGTFVSAGYESAVLSSGVSRNRINGKITEFGYYDDLGVWQRGMYYDAVNDRLTVDKLRVTSEAILPGGLTATAVLGIASAKCLLVWGTSNTHIPRHQARG